MPSMKKTNSKNKKTKTVSKLSSRPKSKAKTQKKKFYQNAKFWGVIGAIGAVVMLAVITITVTVTTSKQHEKVMAEYIEVWDEYVKAQNDLGYQFGLLLSELGFSMDGTTKYNLDSNTQYELSKECTKKLGVYEDVFDNPYATKDTEIAKKSTSDIDMAVKSLRDYTDKITKAMTSVEQCKEVGEAKIKAIDEAVAKKEAEEKAKAEEEEAKKRRQEEYARNKLDYDKFNNQIREGMSLASVKNVYGGFDSQCKVSSDRKSVG